MAVIYYIKNIQTNKYYIGETIDFISRIKRHLYDLKHQQHHSHKLQNAFNQYGEESFDWGVVCEIDDEIRFNKEIEIIQQYNSYYDGYNETLGGDHPGYEKLCKPIYCYNLDGSYRGTSFSSGREASRKLGIQQAVIQKICAGIKYKARDISGEWYRFSYELLPQLPKLRNTNGQAKQVGQFNQQQKLIQKFDSAADVNRFFGISSQSPKIYQAIKEQKLYKGYYWKYL